MSRKRILLLALGFLMVLSASMVHSQPCDWKRIYVEADNPPQIVTQPYAVHCGAACPYEMNAERCPALGGITLDAAHYEFSCYNQHYQYITKLHFGHNCYEGGAV